MIINGISVEPGEEKLIELTIARLPSGTNIHLPVYVFRSKEEGPSVLLSGGLHGDEVNGIETVRRLLAHGILSEIKKGTVIAVPMINVYGFINFSREVPDGKDVNRSFPGNPDGSLASLVAHTLTAFVLPYIDFGIDLHTGGASRTNYPQVRHATEDAFSADLAKQFQAPFTIHSNLIEGSLRYQAYKMGKSILVYEGGESMRFDEFSIQEAVNGILRLLKAQGMVEDAPGINHECIDLKKTSWIRASASGLFQAVKVSGQAVSRGELIGVINDPSNQYEKEITTPEDAYIIGHNNIPVVHKGDAIFHLGMY